MRYGEVEFAILKPEEEHGNIPREEHKEREILFLVRQWFPHLDEKKRELDCGKDEECMYQERYSVPTVSPT